MSERGNKKKFFFEDYCVADEFKSISHTVGKKEIIEFAKEWDPQPFHTDEQVAKDSHFGGLTACSAHLFSIFCRISQQWELNVEQQVIASLGFDEMRMHKPLYLGDTVYCLAKVELVRPSNSNPERGIVASRCFMVNQKDEQVFSVLTSFLMQRRPKKAS